MSTYTAFDNNPVYWADPSGADAIVNGGYSSGADWSGFEFGESVWDRSESTDPKEEKKKKKETAVQKAARKVITSIADKAIEKSNGKWAMPATDKTVSAYQLFIQWVYGIGPDVRKFDENSVMGKQMLQAPEVMDAICVAAKQAGCDDDCTTKVRFFRDLSDINPITYALDDFPTDIGGRNPARGFHGSINNATISIIDATPVDGGSLVNMTIMITDYMTAVSGTRASGTVGGYGDNPIAIYPTQNPYGPRGQFRTITANYRLNVQYFQPTDK